MKTNNSSSSGQIGTIIIFLFLVFFCILIGKFTVLGSPILVLGLVGGLIIALITLVNTSLALIILIFSMLLSPELKLVAIPQSAVVVRIDDILLIGVFFTWLAKMAINKQMGLLKHTRLNLPIIAYILVCILSTAIGIMTGHVQPLESLFYILKYIEYFMLFFMVSNNIRSKEQVRNFIIIFLITCALTCSYAIATVGQFGRATAPFEGEFAEPNTLGGYLIILFAIAAGIFLYSPSRIWRYCCSSVLLYIFDFITNTLTWQLFSIYLYVPDSYLLDQKKKALAYGDINIGHIYSSSYGTNQGNRTDYQDVYTRKDI